MNYIVFDLEATCWGPNEPHPGQPEIIEIGAVKVDQYCQFLEEFEQFVQPKQAPILSDFCKGLTTIRQDQVDNAPIFPVAIENFRNWIGKEDYSLVAWGNWDKELLVLESERHGINDNWVKNYINMKEQYNVIRWNEKPIGLKIALRRENILLEGTAHRGIDDAYNTAKLFEMFFDFWKVDF